jgi:hypothetical protein
MHILISTVGTPACGYPARLYPCTRPSFGHRTSRCRASVRSAARLTGVDNSCWRTSGARTGKCRLIGARKRSSGRALYVAWSTFGPHANGCSQGAKLLLSHNTTTPAVAPPESWCSSSMATTRTSPGSPRGWVRARHGRCRGFRTPRWPAGAHPMCADSGKDRLRGALTHRRRGVRSALLGSCKG